MKETSSRILSAVAAALVAFSQTGAASTVNILWYTGGAQVDGAAVYPSYVAGINDLKAKEATAFNVSGSINTWNITYWSGGAKPAGTFNVLVAASREGPWSTAPTYGALTAAVTEASFGDRVMLTGQDADWHLMNTPGPALFNNPSGFLIDAINWAGSGNGMGGVFLSTGVESNIFSGVGIGSGVSSNVVNIPPAFATFPINAGLTSAGLSNWTISAHDQFTGFDATKWEAINVGNGNAPITIVSKATVSGGTGVPDSGSTLAMLLAALLGCVAVQKLSRRARQTAA